MSEGVGISGRGLTARGPAGSVFENIDLLVHPGELAVVTGASGTGRTCMLLALSGRLRLIAGRLKVAGLALPRRAGTARKLLVPARLRPGVELEPEHRVRQVLREREMISGARRESIVDAFELVGIDPRPSVLVGELHPVDRLLLAVALAAATEPAGILVDDVDLGLPEQHVARAWSALRAVARTGTTVLAAAVDPPDECDAVIELPHPREPELPWQPTRDDPDAPTVEFHPVTRPIQLPSAGTAEFGAVDADGSAAGPAGAGEAGTAASGPDAAATTTDAFGTSTSAPTSADVGDNAEPSATSTGDTGPIGTGAPAGTTSGTTTGTGPDDLGSEKPGGSTGSSVPQHGTTEHGTTDSGPDETASGPDPSGAAESTPEERDESDPDGRGGAESSGGRG